MTLEWALLDQEFYIQAVLYAAVNSGMYAQLVQGASKKDLDTLQGVLGVPWQILIEALVDLGYVEQEGTGWRWNAEPPAARSLHGMDIMRRWLNISHSSQDESPCLSGAIQSSEEERLRESSRQLNQWILDTLSCSKPRTWLDVGGASGTLALALADQGIEVTMIDTPDTIDKVSGILHHPFVKLVGGDIRSQLPKGPFDVVSLVRLIENFPVETMVAIFKKIKPQIHPQGRLVVVITEKKVGTLASLFSLEVHMTVTNGHLYSLRELKVIAVKSHWKILHISQRGHLTMVVLQPLRTSLKRYSKPLPNPVAKLAQLL